jgi:crossover junction endodeoxyribonuclease RuvC
MSITGNGNASKEQVALMLQRILNIQDMPKFFDATDAVAVALCHSYQSKISVKDTKAHSWKEFVQQNKDRLV